MQVCVCENISKRTLKNVLEEARVDVMSETCICIVLQRDVYWS